MRFGKTIFTKTTDLRKNLFGVSFGITALLHTVDELGFELQQFAVFFPAGHGPAQLIGFAAGKTGRDHCEFNHLFLKNRHAHSAAQYRLDFG